jgi:DNA-nicking Smr family endonuclease
MSASDEDMDFWFEAVKDVKSGKKQNIVTKNPKTDIKIKPHQQYAVKQEFSTYSKDIDDFEGGIDKATLRKFKKEEFAIEAVLDLHGLTEDEAFERVDNFIPQCYNQGKRCVVIVTGKGLSVHENDDIFTPKGILRKQVPQWLNMPRLRGMILVYKHPTERLGGQGALYILLRRNKDLS